MDEKDLMKARMKELSLRASEEDYMTHTSFLTLSEQNLFYEILKEEHIDTNTHTLSGSHYIFYGGREDSDRNILFFLPYYMKEEDFYEKMKEGDTITCLKITPKNVKFADKLTHRDYLGALMHLGYERNVFGDILTDGATGYLFLLKSLSSQVAQELQKIKHTIVETEEINPKDCPFKQEFKEEKIIVASNRIDSIIGEVYHLSRRSAQVLLASESVFVNGKTILSNSYSLKPNSRVSIKGKGKFLYLGNETITKKGRLCVSVKLYI